jgi:hypothetical protein
VSLMGIVLGVGVAAGKDVDGDKMDVGEGAAV